MLGCETKLATIHNSFPDLAAAAVLYNILSIIIQGFTFAEVNKCPDQTTGCYYNALLAVSFWLWKALVLAKLKVLGHNSN